MLRYIGCTGHAHEVASVFGDEIAIRAQTLVHDAANPAEVMHDVLAFATTGHPHGNGYPKGVRGEEIPLAMRVVHLSHDMEAIGRLFSPARAVEAAHDRRDRTYDLELADLFAAHGSSWFDRLQKMQPWDAVLDLEPEPHRTLQGAEWDDALTVVAETSLT